MKLGSLQPENVAKNWAIGYDGPALAAGLIKKEEIPNKVPQGMQGFGFNTRKALFVTSGSTKRVIDMPEKEGMALVAELIAYATQERFVYRHKWRNNDCLIWNDMCTMHTATPYDESKYDRLVYRTWMRPFEVADSTTRDEEMMSHH